MMKVISLFAALLVAASAAPMPQNPDAEAKIVKFDSANSVAEGYKYSVETSNGISQEEEGHLENAGAEDEAIVVRGSYSYTGPDGQVYTVTYIADKNGFQPQGEHIPQVPGIPTDGAAPSAQLRAAPPAVAAPPAPVAAQPKPASAQPEPAPSAE